MGLGRGLGENQRKAGGRGAKSWDGLACAAPTDSSHSCQAGTAGKGERQGKGLYSAVQTAGHPEQGAKHTMMAICKQKVRAAVTVSHLTAQISCRYSPLQVWEKFVNDM